MVPAFPLVYLPFLFVIFFILDICENGGDSKPLSAQVTSRVLLISVVLHLFVRCYVAVSKVKCAENLHFVLSSPD